MDRNNDIQRNLPLEDIWNESSGKATSRTFSELMRLNKRIDAAEKARRRLRGVFSAVAVAASLAVVAMATFMITRRAYTVSPLDATVSLVAEYGQTKSITLEDGTRVSLNAGSTLLYPKTFKGGSRIVYLTGEGNFSVAKDPSRPFIVKSAHMDVQALGTCFCVHSYAGENTVRTTLKEGRVKVDVPAAGEESYFLEPGMQIVYSIAENNVTLARVDAAKVMSWEDGYLSFTNATFPYIVSVLERRFNVTISYDSKKILHNSINVRFRPEESLEDDLEVLTLLIPGSRYTIDGDRVYFRF